MLQADDFSPLWISAAEWCDQTDREEAGLPERAVHAWLLEPPLQAIALGASVLDADTAGCSASTNDAIVINVATATAMRLQTLQAWIDRALQQALDAGRELERKSELERERETLALQRLKLRRAAIHELRRAEFRKAVRIGNALPDVVELERRVDTVLRNALMRRQEEEAARRRAEEEALLKQRAAEAAHRRAEEEAEAVRRRAEEEALLKQRARQAALANIARQRRKAFCGVIRTYRNLLEVRPDYVLTLHMRWRDAIKIDAFGDEYWTDTNGIRRSVFLFRERF